MSIFEFKNPRETFERLYFTIPIRKYDEVCPGRIGIGALSTLAHKFDHVFCTRSLGCGRFAFEMLSRHLCQKTVQILFGEVPFERFGDCLIVGLETR